MGDSTDKEKISYGWYFVSALLLIVYLAFFHLLNVVTPEQMVYLGAGFGTLWLGSCFVFQSCFRNRFEYGIHTLVTLDIFIESMIPFHTGYSFYLCATGFWLVFLFYHHLPMLTTSSSASEVSI